MEQSYRQGGDPADLTSAVSAPVAAADADSMFELLVPLPVLHQVPAVFEIGVPVLGPGDRGAIEFVSLRGAGGVFLLRMSGVAEDEVRRLIEHASFGRFFVASFIFALIERLADARHLLDEKVHDELLVFLAEHPPVKNTPPPVGKPEQYARRHDVDAIIWLAQFVTQAAESDQMRLELPRHVRQAGIALAVAEGPFLCDEFAFPAIEGREFVALELGFGPSFARPADLAEISPPMIDMVDFEVILLARFEFLRFGGLTRGGPLYVPGPMRQMANDSRVGGLVTGAQEYIALVVRGYLECVVAGFFRRYKTTDAAEEALAGEPIELEHVVLFGFQTAKTDRFIFGIERAGREGPLALDHARAQLGIVDALSRPPVHASRSVLFRIGVCGRRDLAELNPRAELALDRIAGVVKKVVHRPGRRGLALFGRPT